MQNDSSRLTQAPTLEDLAQRLPTPPKVLSCAECRRSKLRCDRDFPCQTCRKRGLEHLCPNESLTTRPKSLVLDAELLRRENIRLQERIRELEGALVLLTRFPAQTYPPPVSQPAPSSLPPDMSGWGHGYLPHGGRQN